MPEYLVEWIQSGITRVEADDAVAAGKSVGDYPFADDADDLQVINVWGNPHNQCPTCGAEQENP